MTLSQSPAYGQPTRRVPQPPGLPLLGNLLQLNRQGQLAYTIEQWDRLGDIMCFKLGPVLLHFVAHPDYIRHVLIENRQNYVRGRGYAALKLLNGEGLLTSDEPFWKQQRRLIQPAFTPKVIPHYAPDITAALAQHRTRWDALAAQGIPIDINQEMLALALNLIGVTMLSVDLGAETETIGAAFKTTAKIVGQRISAALHIPLKVPTPSNQRFNRAYNVLAARIDTIIRERQSQPSQNHDFLDQLLAARDAETGAGMHPAQMRDEMITMLFAGHETIAQTLTWAWYLLAQHPAIEAQVVAEASSVLDGELPTASDLAKLPYTRKVIDEVLRLYPAVWAIPRGAIGPDVIDGYAIPGGSMVFCSPYLAHRHPAFWANPEQFDPERFTPEQIAERPNCAYLPFGAGPRACIGQAFALQEAVMVVASLAQRYRLHLVPDHPVVPHSVITLSPQFGIQMNLERRN